MKKTLDSIIKGCVWKISENGLLNWIPDEAYLKFMYRLRMKKKLKLNNPHTFNEKLQWLKLHDRKFEYVKMVDKYEAKKYVQERIGAEYIIPTLGVWENFDDIDFEVLPNQFVLKCTHDSGGVVICKDKSRLDLKKARKKINKSLKVNYYWLGREWIYKNIEPRIIAEKYMIDDSQNGLKSYKFYCGGGVCKCMKAEFDNFIEYYGNDFDTRMNLLYLLKEICPPDFNKNITLSENNSMITELVKIIDKEKPLLTTDFYDVNSTVYEGEINFYARPHMDVFSHMNYQSKTREWIAVPNTREEQYVILGERLIISLRKKKYQEQYKGLIDYKFYCFNGKPKYLYISEGLDDHLTAKISFLDMKWNKLPFDRSDFAAFDVLPNKPHRFNQMKKIAENLSKGKDFLRVDLYQINEQIFFSEMTFHPCSGFMPFVPEEWDQKFGECIILSNLNEKNDF